MTRAFIIKDEPSYKSLMVDMWAEGCKWYGRDKPHEEGYEYGNWIEVVFVDEYGAMSAGSLDEITKDFISGGNNLAIIHYEAKPENLGLTFKEVLDMEWYDFWKISFSHPDSLRAPKFEYLEDFLRGLADKLVSDDIHKILREGRFFINRGENRGENR